MLGPMKLKTEQMFSVYNGKDNTAGYVCDEEVGQQREHFRLYKKIHQETNCKLVYVGCMTCLTLSLEKTFK